MTEQELYKLKEDIEKTKNSLSQLDGRKSYLIQELNEKWDCKNIKIANKKIKKMETEIKNLEEEIESKKDKIEKML